MTCIVGVVDQEKVYIGGDSAGVAGLDITSRKDPKVFKVGDFLIGCTTSFRMIQLIRFSFCPPKRHPDKDVFEYMCTEFINEIRSCLKTGGFAEISCSVENGGNFLVGYCGRLFKIEGDFQVGESTDNFQSVGCGQPFALGALSALGDSLNPKDRIRKALEIASYHSAGVRGPFVIESI